MKAQDFVKSVAEEGHLSHKDAADLIDSVFTCIAKGLVAGEKITISGFGTFESKVRPARKGINPATKAVIDIPEKTVVAFKAAKNLKEIVAK